MAKIIAADDVASKLSNLEEALAGHEIVLFYVGQDSPMGDLLFGGLARLINKAKPDVLLLDHRLSTLYTGADVAKLLEIPIERRIGTSVSDEQPYCGQQFNTANLNDLGAQKRLREMVENLLQQAS